MKDLKADKIYTVSYKLIKFCTEKKWENIVN